MVAVIHSGSSLRNAVNYNEQKVKEEVATCLAAVHYPKDVDELNFHQKLNRLQKLADLNLRTKVNSVHVSLNFHPSEKELSTDKLREIANVYMQKIGFAGQPYLLYQHNDAGHPHLHIVTTNIKADGRRIELHNLGKNQSEKARKEIEKDYHLVKAEDMRKQPYDLKSIQLQKVQYGSIDSRRAIAKVLEAVLNNYRYTSLPELNAVLKQYNVLADSGSEHSRTFLNKGLLYHILDEKGNKTGVPIKASLFYNKPTLQYLEERFLLNEAARQPYKARVKNAIDLILLRQSTLSVQGLIKALEKEGVNTVLRQNTEGVIYGITYVDFRTKCVFNGSALGKQYSAKAMQERCEQAGPSDIKSAIHYLDNIQLLHGLPSSSGAGAPDKKPDAQTASFNMQQVEQSSVNTGVTGSLLDSLLQPEQTLDYIPTQLKNKSKKKKKKHNNHL